LLPWRALLLLLLAPPYGRRLGTLLIRSTNQL
jgi:hypothetical protein